MSEESRNPRDNSPPKLTKESSPKAQHNNDRVIDLPEAGGRKLQVSDCDGRPAVVFSDPRLATQQNLNLEGQAFTPANNSNKNIRIPVDIVESASVMATVDRDADAQAFENFLAQVSLCDTLLQIE